MLMENGVEGVNGDHHEKDMNLALKDESLKLEFVDTGSEGVMKDSVNEFKGLVKDLEENDVFEEAALGPEIFYTPAYRFRTPDLHDMAFDVVESSVRFGRENFDEEGKEFDGSSNVVEQELNVFEKLDAPVSDQNTEEPKVSFETKVNGVEDDGVIEEGSFVMQDGGGNNTEYGVKKLTKEEAQNGEYNGAVFDQDHGDVHEEVDNGLSLAATSEETFTGSEEQANRIDQGGETFETKFNGIEADSVIKEGGETILENGMELSEENPQNWGHNDMSFEPGRGILHEEDEISLSLLATSDEVGVGTVTEFKEENLTKHGVEHLANGSAGFDSPSGGHTTNTQSLSVQLLSTVTETDNRTMARSYASVVKEDASPKEAKAEECSTVSASEVAEDFNGGSVLVEDMSDSSSTDADGSIAPSQPAPPVRDTAYPESSGGPTLPSCPAGLGSSAPLLEPAPRSLQQPRANGVAPQRQSQISEGPANDDLEENDEIREKLQMIRVKFLRLSHRLGQTPHNVVVAQVLYRLGLAEQLRRNTNRPGVFSFDRASVMAEQLEAMGKEALDFSCTIMVIGKTGVGKSATINSIFDEVKFHTDAFKVSTKKVQDIVGTVQGIKVRIIDTPGLYPSSSDQWRNDKILHSVKNFISKTPPDIVLYFDRLDMQSRDYGDALLLRSITDIFGSSIWFNAIIVLTHAASAPPDGPNGTPLSYEMFVTQRSHVVQQSIRQAAHDLRLMNPVSLVENHSACRMNRAGQRVLPNGQVWKPHLLLLSFASKILAEANMLLQLQDTPPGRLFGSHARVPPLPFFLSSLLQLRPQLKLPEEQFGDDFTGDEDLDKASDSDNGSDYDDLPPFKSLNKSQLAKLSKLQKKAYFEELEYREKLFFRKQLKEEKRRRKFMKKMSVEAKDFQNNYNTENVEDENSGPASVPVSDLALPASFDSDNATHRYRFLDTASQWIVRPVLENHVWDHDVGYDGLNVERLFAIKDKIPLSVSGQLTKDKKECTFQMELTSSIKHGNAGATSLGLDIQTVGKDMAYTLRGETRIKNFRRNSTAAGVSVTQLGDAMSAGVKIEDNLVVNKRFKLLMSGGAMTGRGDVAYGGRLEATLRDKDYPIGRNLSTVALNVVDWHGDLAINCNVQSQIPVGRGTNVIGHASLNNKGTGQVAIRLNSSEQLQIALLALVPVFRHAKRIIFGSSQMLD